MNKSVVIVLAIVWLIGTAYFSFARVYGYPYSMFGLGIALFASALLLASIIIYFKKHRK
jgi:hypothetical protein